MAREMIDEMDVEKVVGGSIVFNGSHTTCGYNRNDQYKVNDYSAAMQYLKENYGKMSEKKLLSNLASMGYISSL